MSMGSVEGVLSCLREPPMPTIRKGASIPEERTTIG